MAKGRRPRRPTGSRKPAAVESAPVPRPGGTSPASDEQAPVRTPTAGPAAETAPPSASPLRLDGIDPQALVILASLRIVDRRLVLSGREVTELAPAVAEWLTQGMGPEEITNFLTNDLPSHFRSRPARVLAYRLREIPVPTPTDPSGPPPARSAVLPWQTCDGCERAFSAVEPSLCRDCSLDNGGDHHRRAA
ncbi:hypothetical protein [Streptomyces lincolnensis]|uniref:hypothetical protein n=1 Tax=Streptomyces lincolnensis TaxID=1915 RepID=UPI0026A67D36